MERGFANPLYWTDEDFDSSHGTEVLECLSVIYVHLGLLLLSIPYTFTQHFLQCPPLSLAPSENVCTNDGIRFCIILLWETWKNACPSPDRASVTGLSNDSTQVYLGQTCRINDFTNSQKLRIENLTQKWMTASSLVIEEQSLTSHPDFSYLSIFYNLLYLPRPCVTGRFECSWRRTVGTGWNLRWRTNYIPKLFLL